MDANEVGHKLDQLRSLKYGEKIIYHVGFLANDRGDEKNNPISQIARLAWDLSEKGLIALTQRKCLRNVGKTGRYNLL